MGHSGMRAAFGRRLGGKYTALLALLLVVPVVQGLVEKELAAEFFFWLAMQIALMGALVAIGRTWHAAWVVALVGVPSLAATLSYPLLGYNPRTHLHLWVGFRHGATLLFLAALTGIILADVLRVRRVVFDQVCGGLCVYMMLGLVWALAYAAVEGLFPGSFALDRPRYGLPEDSVGFRLLSVMTYYSFITLSTVGYGDISPVKAAARGLAWSEAVIGQFYMAVLLARLVSLHLAHASKAPRRPRLPRRLRRDGASSPPGPHPRRRPLPVSRPRGFGYGRKPDAPNRSRALAPEGGAGVPPRRDAD